jgi:hypothetical protein
MTYNNNYILENLEDLPNNTLKDIIRNLIDENKILKNEN